jgi:hypothetical protein
MSNQAGPSLEDQIEVTAQSAVNSIDHVSVCESIWPIALLIISAIITAAWFCFLGFALVQIGGLFI